MQSLITETRVLQDLASEDDHDEPADLQTHGVNGGEADSDVQAAGCQGSSVTVGEGRGAGVAPHCYAPAAAIRGDAIPSEVGHVHEPKQLLTYGLITD